MNGIQKASPRSHKIGKDLFHLEGYVLGSNSQTPVKARIDYAHFYPYLRLVLVQSAFAQIGPTTPATPSNAPSGHLDLITEFIGKRILNVYGGTQEIKDLLDRNGKTSIQGYIGFQAHLFRFGIDGRELNPDQLEAEDGRNTGLIVLPIQFEMNTRREVFVSVGGVEFKNMNQRGDVGLFEYVNNLKFLRFKYDRTLPCVETAELLVGEFVARYNLLGHDNNYVAAAGGYGGAVHWNEFQTEIEQGGVVSRGKFYQGRGTFVHSMHLGIDVQKMIGKKVSVFLSAARRFNVMSNRELNEFGVIDDTTTLVFDGNDFRAQEIDEIRFEINRHFTHKDPNSNDVYPRKLSLFYEGNYCRKGAEMTVTGEVDEKSYRKTAILNNTIPHRVGLKLTF